VGHLVSRIATAVLCGAALAARLAAQLPEAEDAFDRGDYRTARALYDSVLARDSLSPRALYRLAILDSWDGKLQQSLTRFATLRRVDPTDPDIMVAQARVLSWAGDTRRSEALYDSVLVQAPDRADALAGRARAVAWGGDLDRAERLWREALDRHPDDPEILTGLAQTLYWEGRPELAEGYATRARALAPNDRTTRDLYDQLRAERRPVVSLSSDAIDDIEHNAAVTVNGDVSASLRRDLRGSLLAAWRRNDAGSRSASSVGLAGLVVKSLRGGASLRAGLGFRALGPDSGATRTFPTLQLGLGLRPATSTAVALSYTHDPFDETVTLVDSGFVWDEVEASVDLSPRSSVDLSGVLNVAALSDGNRRTIAGAAAMFGVARGLKVGGYGRILGYHEANPGRGYFAPDRFLVGESRAVYVWRRTGWALRLTAALGAQQVGSTGPTQAEWHGDVMVSRSWRAIDELALVGTFTNSAAARAATETRETYRYWSVGLRYRRGL
jgi:tetratricopeptide (TPR) repeat protein